jgi:transposase
VKALYFDGSGLLLCAKPLARGRFDWPEEIEGVAKVGISATEFAALIDGLELTRTRAKLWWRKKVEPAM